jgi:G:T-mismatch repair DNA endonuclease (very short patch repair protein)
MIKDTSLTQKEIVDGYCGCNCGEITNVWRGKHRKFIKGHQARGSCNSRFGVVMDDSLKEKISDARKLQGSPWWNNRKHTKSSKDKMSVIRKIIFLGEGNLFYGKHHSEDTKEKLRITSTRQRAKTFVLPSKPESEIHKKLLELSIFFETEKLINDKFCVDVFIPSRNLIIYIDGCYWHSCPEHCPNGHKPKTDNARIPYLTKCGFNVEIIWEHDIMKNLNRIMDDLCLKYNLIS